MKGLALAACVFYLVSADIAAANPKYGALAVDRNNGFFYGWTVDQASESAAEQRAEAECRKRGGTCSVVLVWSGPGCVAYRTVDGDAGTAYGWGIAAARPAADAIARREAEKRSGGRPASNHVYGCNSEKSGQIKVLREESAPAAGKMTFKDEEGDPYEYVGAVRDGKPDGKGLATWSNGQSYEGDFEKGKRHGTGVYKFASGAYFTGELKNDSFHYGTFYVNNPNNYLGISGCKIYVGEFRNNMPNGQGKCTREDGTLVYEGLWVDRRPAR